MIQRAVTPQRVQKLLAAEGVGSRRDIEDLIRCGKVRVNGRVVQIGDRASMGDEIYVGDQCITIHKTSPAIIAYHKQCGEVVSRRDCFNKIVFENFPKLECGRWIAVGRLDINTTGLLLACNDGELAHRLMHPSYQIPRVYHARVKGDVADSVLQRLLEGVMLDERIARFESIKRLKDSDGVNTWFEVMLKEGRNREIRRLWQSQEFEVDRLIRVSFADVSLDIPLGIWQALSQEEIKRLYSIVNLACTV